jgi:hypothetical protein
VGVFRGTRVSPAPLLPKTALIASISAAIPCTNCSISCHLYKRISIGWVSLLKFAFSSLRQGLSLKVSLWSPIFCRNPEKIYHLWNSTKLINTTKGISSGTDITTSMLTS